MGDTCQDGQVGPGSPCALAVGEGQAHLSSCTSSEVSHPLQLLQGLSESSYEFDSLHNLFVFNGYFSEIYVNLLWNKLNEMANDTSLYFLQPQPPNVLYISSFLSSH